MSSPYNPSKAVRFELGRGRVSLGDHETRVLVSPEALTLLCKAAGEEGMRDFGKRLGTEIGHRVSQRLPKGGSISEMVDHLGGDVALSGLGSLAIETWGRALVLKIEGSPLGPEGDALLCAIFEGALQRAAGRDVVVLPLSRADATVRLLVVNPRAAGTVKGWLGAGVPWGEALTRLNRAGASGGSMESKA